MDQLVGAASSSSVKDIPIFFYGTLQRGFFNYERCKLNEEEFVGRAETVDEGSMLYSGYIPFVNLSGGINRIQGELFMVSNEKLKVLDILESYGEDGGYDRIQLKDKKTDDGQPIVFFTLSVKRAFIYTKTDSDIDEYPEVRGADYRQFILQQQTKEIQDQVISDISYFS